MEWCLECLRYCVQEYTHPASSDVFMPMDESNLEPAENMVKLGDLHEAALLHNVRMRFFNDDIFTYIGPILVAANPYKMVNIFSGEYVTVRHPPPSDPVRLCRFQTSVVCACGALTLLEILAELFQLPNRNDNASPRI
jgi:hypothetical protein